MRRGIDTLTQYITDQLHQPWQQGAAFVFCNKAHSRMKVLRWDKARRLAVPASPSPRSFYLAQTG